MPLKSEGGPQRRRGRALEEAILDAAWTELTEAGYDGFTIDAAAARAGTSRAVLYRRWTTKQELVHAAIGHAVAKDPVAPPDTGTLRGDVIAILRQANRQRLRLATQLFTSLGEFYRATGTSLEDLAAGFSVDRDALITEAIERAAERGEIASARVPPRIARLAGDLFRYEVLMTLKPVSDDTIDEIVDMVFLPLVRG